MKKSLYVAAILAAALTTFGSAQAGNADANAYKAALAQAKAAIDKAASVDGEWRDIRWKKSKHNVMKMAAEAAKAGDMAKALKLLDMAKFEAEMGYQQAMEQKNAGPHFK